MTPETSATTQPAQGKPRGTAGEWPAAYLVLGLLFALLLAGLGAALISAVPGARDGDDLVPVAAQGATLLQGIAFVLVPLVLARRHGRPTLGDFGVVGIAPRRLLATMAIAFVAFLAFTALWEAVVGAGGSQDTLERLGADRDTGLRIAAAVLVIVIAPLVEEILFRGFMYRAARNAVGPVVAALAVGLIFGLMHLTSADSAPLVPLLVVLGALMCVLYERTGSLLAPIGLHVVNNTVAFSAAGDIDGAAQVGVPLGIAMLVLVVWMGSIRGRGAPQLA